ncbi:MAG: hypothetical protein AAGE65_10735 [Planctomycetota bacterium]
MPDSPLRARLPAVFVFLWGCVASAGAAIVVEDTNIQLIDAGVVTLDDGGVFPRYELSIALDVAGTQVATAFFASIYGQMVLDEGTLDDVPLWYLWFEGQEISFSILQAVDLASVFELALSPASPFYISVKTSDESRPESRSVFGWARLARDGDQLILEDNAVAYGAAGIIVGTSNLVPEPAAAAMAGFGLLGRRRRC